MIKLIGGTEDIEESVSAMNAEAISAINEFCTAEHIQLIVRYVCGHSGWRQKIVVNDFLIDANVTVSSQHPGEEEPRTTIVDIHTPIDVGELSRVIDLSSLGAGAEGMLISIGHVAHLLSAYVYTDVLCTQLGLKEQSEELRKLASNIHRRLLNTLGTLEILQCVGIKINRTITNQY